ncbi:glycosyltransferase family A protein [Desulfovibrio sp. UCD-KL4C]|uniref:glycosyltransferase family 2 protein n=1 Tax=Desulfovibrio sp. UCD-KL4C TaxID=2578120 RepID=UPI0025BF3473|nr:glycosyltransferase family A protein [Desulfovibrio sp. UCD-KL4C]
MPNYRIRCCVLVATLGRSDKFLKRAIPSIQCQSVKPEAVVIVCDGKPFGPEICAKIKNLLLNIPVFFLANTRTPGVAGAWNSGLLFLRENINAEYVALLDDDDSWDNNHLYLNLTSAQKNDSNVVVSGLRIVKDGVPVECDIITSLNENNFLIGNPGWQGSNTFISVDLLFLVGDFREGLASLNDRDLAIRVIRHPQCKISYTGSWSATWYLTTKGNQLSSFRNSNKISGLRSFWGIYRDDMSEAIQRKFFSRAEKLFGVPKQEITIYDK